MTENTEPLSGQTPYTIEADARLAREELAQDVRSVGRGVRNRARAAAARTGEEFDKVRRATRPAIRPTAEVAAGYVIAGPPGAIGVAIGQRIRANRTRESNLSDRVVEGEVAGD